jgi:branched-chain amino acid aminotransferase
VRAAVWLDGRLVPLRRARVSVFDRGFLQGDGVYETIRAYRGRPFRLVEHLARLRASARAVGIALPGGVAPLGRAVAAVLRRLGGAADARVRITVTRGNAGPDPAPRRDPRPTRVVTAAPYTPPSPAEYARGVPAVVTRIRRNDRRAQDPAIKATSLLNTLLALREARRAGAREAILLAPDGRLAEAASANLFFVRGGTLHTPALESGILAGVTRALVLDLARRLGIPVREGRYRPTALLGADEAFVTASTIEILPLSSVGRRRFPPIRPVTRALREAYRVTVADELGV